MDPVSRASAVPAAVNPSGRGIFGKIALVACVTGGVALIIITSLALKKRIVPISVGLNDVVAAIIAQQKAH
jgi:hypothetical protein